MSSSEPPKKKKRGVLDKLFGGKAEKEKENPFYGPFDAEKAFNMILGLLTFIADGKDKTLVMLFGESQDGKSTTINAMVHGRYGRTETIEVKETTVVEFGERVKQVQRVPHVSICLEKTIDGLEVAKTGQPNVGISCTPSPTSYPLQTMPDHILLDTRGMCDTKETPEEDVAAAILTDMCIQSARDVKIVVVQRFSNLEGGLVKLGRTGDSLARIVQGFQIPVLFLFNRYPANAANGTGINDVYAEWLRYRYPSGIAPDRIIPVVFNQEQERALLDVEARLQTSIVGQISAKTEEVITAQCKELGLKSSSDSSEVTRNLVEQAEKMDKKGLKYLAILNESMKKGFVSYFAPESQYSIDRLKKGISKLEAIPKEMLVYSSSNIHTEEVKEVFRGYLAKYRGVLDAAAFVKRFNSTLIDVLSRQQDEKVKQLEEQKKECRDKAKGLDPKVTEKGLEETRIGMIEGMERAKERIKKAECAVSEIEKSKTPMFLKRDKGHEEDWKGKYVCKYRGTIPIVDVIEHPCGKYTSREVTSIRPKDFCVTYSWGSLGTVLEVVSGWFDVLKLVDHTCGEWNVEFFCLPKDHPDKIEEMRRYEQEISRLRGDLVEKERIISQIREISSREEELDFLIGMERERQQKLVMFKQFISRIKDKYEKDKNIIEQCYKLCRMWNPEGVDCSVFIDSFQHYQDTVPEEGPGNVELDELFSDQRGYEEDLDRLFGDDKNE